MKYPFKGGLGKDHKEPRGLGEDFGVTVADELTRHSGHSREAQRKPGGPTGRGVRRRHGLWRVVDVSPGLLQDEGSG